LARLKIIIDDAVVPSFHLFSLSLLRRSDDDDDGDECIRLGKFNSIGLLKRRHQEAMFQRRARLRSAVQISDDFIQRKQLASGKLRALRRGWECREC
jgi:methyltransferase-like protein